MKNQLTHNPSDDGNLVKRVYISPVIDMVRVELESGIAAGSTTARVVPGGLGSEYEVKETWKEEVIHENVNW